MPHYLLRSIPVIGLAVMLAWLPAFAQPITGLRGQPQEAELLQKRSPMPWSHSAISLNFISNINDTRFHRFWKPQSGLAVRWSMPFYFGEIEAEAGFYSFSALSEAQPDFFMATTALGWGLRRQVTERLSGLTAFRFGMGYMQFGTGSPFTGLESEFFIAPVAELRYHIHPHWYLAARAEHKRVFTYHRLDLTYISFGTGFRFPTPRILRSLLDYRSSDIAFQDDMVTRHTSETTGTTSTGHSDFFTPHAKGGSNPGASRRPQIRPGETVITREMIEAASLTRLSDVFGLVSDWHYKSVNGFDTFVAPAGLSGWKRPTWKIMVDGQEFDLNFLDFQSINLLPVNLVDVEKVTFISRPGYVEGVWSTGGIMKITTRRQREDGADFHVRIMAGNEINDPGPFEFTDLRTPNEERTGPDYELSTGYRSGRHFVRGGVRYQEHKSTDTPIERRIKLMRVTDEGVYHDAVNRGVTSFLQAGTDRGRFRHQLFASRTSVHDFYYFYPVGRDIPVRWNIYHVGWSGSAGINERHQLQWQSSLNNRTARYKRNRDGIDLDAPVQTIRNRVMISSRSGPVSYNTGVSHMFFRDADWGEQGESFSVTDLFATGLMALTPSYHIEIQTGMQTDFSAAGYRLGMEHQVRIHPGLQLTGRLVWQDMLRREQPDIWVRRQVIMRVLDPLEGFRVPDTEQMLYGSLGLSTRLGVATDFGADLSLTKHKNYFYSHHPYQMVPNFQWFTHPVTLSDDHSPVIAGITVTLADRSFEAFRHQLSYRYQTEISEGDPAGFDLFPRHRITLGSTFSPVPGLDFRVDVRAQTSVTWQEYDLVDGQTYTDINELVFYTYSNTTGPYVNLDAAVGKSLWDNRLRISFRGTNLLDQGYFLYPVGLDYDLTFHAQIEFNI